MGVRSRAVVAVVAVVAAACSGGGTPTGGGGTTTTADRTTTTTTTLSPLDGIITLGVLVPEHGGPPFPDADPARMRAAVAAVVNAVGGRLPTGEPVLVAEADSGADPDVASAGFERLVGVNVADVVVGPVDPDAVDAVSGRLSRAGVPLCVPGPRPLGRDPVDDGGLAVATAAPASLELTALARRMIADDHRRIVLIGPPDTVRAGASALEAAGVDVAATLEADGDRSPTAEDLPGGDDAPDAVAVMTSSGVTDTLLAGLAADGALEGRAVYLSGPPPPEGLTATAGAAGDVPARVIGIGPQVPVAAPPGVEGTGARRDRFAAWAADCTTLALVAAATVGEGDPERFAAAMIAASREGRACDGPADCLSAAHRGVDVDVDGFSGPLELDDAGEPTAAVYAVYGFTDDGRVADRGTIEVRATGS